MSWGMEKRPCRGAWPLIISLEIKHTLNAEAAFRESQTSRMTATSVKMAAVMVGTLPILCVYPFLQKYFVKGMLTGSVKG